MTLDGRGLGDRRRKKIVRAKQRAALVQATVLAPKPDARGPAQLVQAPSAVGERRKKELLPSPTISVERMSPRAQQGSASAEKADRFLFLRWGSAVELSADDFGEKSSCGRAEVTTDGGMHPLDTGLLAKLRLAAHAGETWRRRTASIERPFGRLP